MRRATAIAAAGITLAAAPAAQAAPVTWRTTIASYYDCQPGGCTTASGRVYTYGVAHRTLPFGTRIRVCARRCVTARVMDRGPFVAGRGLDLNRAAFEATGTPTSAGLARVRWRIPR